MADRNRSRRARYFSRRVPPPPSAEPKQLVEGEDVARVRVVRLFERSLVGDDAHHRLLERLPLREDLDGVAVALAHLLPVGAGHDCGLAVDRLRLGEDLAVGLVEVAGHVAGHLQVLHLVLADRHDGASGR